MRTTSTGRRLGWAAALALCLAPAAARASDEAPRISQEEFKKLYTSGQVLVLDVRSADAYREGHIPGAVSVPLADIEARVEELRSAGKPIVAYCT